MASDFRFAIRNLFRRPKFASIAIVTLAIGMGAATAIFGVSDWILFQATKFPNDVYLIGGASDLSASIPVRFDFQVRAYAEQTAAFSEYAKAAYFPDNIVIDGEPVATNWLGLDANVFPMLGIKPRLGRGFLPDENKEGANDVVIVSDQFWKKNLGGKPEALGKQIRVGASLCTVVGVLRESQNLPGYFFSDVFRPLAYHPDPNQPWTPQVFLLGRLRAGVTRQQASAIISSVKVDTPAPMKQFWVTDHPVLSSMSEANGLLHVEIYWIMIAAVGFLYAIACLNASNLILIRMLGQRREHSIRLSLGSSRRRIVGLLLIDSLLIAFFASLGALIVADLLLPILLVVGGNSGFAPKWTEWSVSWRALSVLGGLTVLTSILIVILPALRILRSDVQAGLKDGGNILGESRTLARLRGAFVILQAALAVILLAGAGLMIQTFKRLQHVDLGFDPVGKAKVLINFPADYPNKNEERLEALRKIQDLLEHFPGVAAVGFGTDVLLPGYYFPTTSIEGPHGSTLHAAMPGISLGFQKAAGLTLKEGHWYTTSNGNEILINESLAHAAWPNQSAVGQLLRTTEKNTAAPADWKGWEVIGVVHDLRATLRDPPGLYIYSHESWAPQNFNAFVLKLNKPYDEAFAGQIRRRLYTYDPRLIVSQIMSLQDARINQLWAENLADSVLEVLAAIALLLTIVGIYSVLAYTVDRRMNEFGVRMALGASRQHLVQWVMRRGLLLTLAGVVIGLIGALLLSWSLKSLLYETSAQNPGVLLVVCALMLATSALACALPSRRAARVDIAQLLRAQ